MHPQLRRGRGCAVGKPAIEILPGRLRQAVPYRRVLHQHHGLAAQRLLQGKTGVVEGLYRQLHPGHLQRGGHAGRAAAAKAVQQGPQYGIHPRAAGQQPPRRQRQADAQVAALHAGQHHRSAQKQVEQCIPRTQPGKTPPPGQAVGGGHHRATCENFITNCHGSRQLRGQQYQCRHCRQRRPGAQPHPGAHGGAQQTGCGEKQRSKDKICQQKLVEVDHAFQCRSPLTASVPPQGKKTCQIRKTGSRPWQK